MQSFSFRLLVVLVTFFIGVFAVSVWMFENQAKFNLVSVNLPTVEQNQNDLVPFFNPREEYEVYSAILANEKREDDVLIVSEDTTIGLIADATDLNQETSVLTEDIIQDFNSKIKKQHKLENNFSIKNKVVLLGEKESRENNGSRTLFTKYPKARAILSFSRVGFNTNRTQALVYFTSWCNPLCGRGDFIFLQKVDGKWTVEREIGLWVS